MSGSLNIEFLQQKVAYLQDEAAYKKLFIHFHPLLITFCDTILNNKEDAEDVVSEVLLKVWTMGKELNYVENLTLYLYKSARNKAYDLIRKRERIIITEDICKHPNVATDALEPEQEYLSVELQKHIESAIRSLPTQCQLVFRLVKDQGLPYRQVTEILGISQNTIESHIRIALSKVRRYLDAYLTSEK